MRVKTAGFTSGIHTRKKIRRIPAPSTVAASIIESGIWVIKFFIKNSPSGVPTAGIMTAHSVLIICRPDIMIYCGSAVTVPWKSRAKTTRL